MQLLQLMWQNKQKTSYPDEYAWENKCVLGSCDKEASVQLIADLMADHSEIWGAAYAKQWDNCWAKEYILWSKLKLVRNFLSGLPLKVILELTYV